MISHADIRAALWELGIGRQSHILVHSSYRSFGGVEGGPAAVVRALVETAGTVMMPATTWDQVPSPWVWDTSGEVPGNDYPSRPPTPRAAVPFTPDLPIDREIGVIAETFRRTYSVLRSCHPLQSFIAYGELAGAITKGTDCTNVGTPIRRLMDLGGDVLLIGVTHTRSTALHLAEHLAGRPLFVRHALTDDGVSAVLCGGCSDGFDEVQPHTERLERRARCGASTLRLYPLAPYVDIARRLITADPNALLCSDSTCGRCASRRTRANRQDAKSAKDAK